MARFSSRAGDQQRAKQSACPLVAHILGKKSQTLNNRLLLSPNPLWLPISLCVRDSLMACETPVKRASPSISSPRPFAGFLCCRYTALLAVPGVCQACICLKASAFVTPFAWNTFPRRGQDAASLSETSAQRGPSQTQPCL